MRNSFNQEALTFLHASLPVSWYSELCKLASAFDSTYTCEQAFSHIKQNIEVLFKNHRCELAFRKWNQILLLYLSKGRPKFLIDTLYLDYFYCNVQFYVGLGRDI
jgi:hypothetical protein